MDFRLSFPPQLEPWFLARGYEHAGFVARGRSAGVWKFRKGARFFAAKIEHEKSFRTQMLTREVRMLRLANEIGIGPRLQGFDEASNLVLMDFVPGIPLAKWILACESKTKLARVLKRVFMQAKKMDAHGIDHGQLGGKLHNILVDARERVHVIDFEKASYVRKTRNVRKLRADLFHAHTRVSQHVQALGGVALEKACVGTHDPIRRV